MQKTNNDVIVISGINLRSGGPLTILKECLEYLSSSDLCRKYRILALVHKKELCEYPNIEYIEYPDSINSWIKRMYYEYFHFKKLSKKLNPYLWLSLHDMTPNVHAKRRAVYMHNPSIINTLKLSDFKYDKTYIAFSLFYKYIYRINIHCNHFCIVQQKWFKNIIQEKFSISSKQIIVARPKQQATEILDSVIPQNCKTFFFPSFPRPFKNFEIICEAAKILYYGGINNIEIRLTIDGSESNYSKDIVTKYNSIPTIKFIGLQDSKNMLKNYETCDCLIFPSRLETWGLPISEFIPFGKPMIIADESYAHETAEGGNLVAFFKTNDARQLANLMKETIRGNFENFKSVLPIQCEQPYASSYEELFQILTK